ncbi:cytidylyltransferase domain-containing protein [Polynucleobacter sp. JS-JIR-5-A7]|uniref:acylneuraminate cytidylyltransferase family protein n=1 Tax=Polynucleobacter sp. JS-JIR-5-A7 TaxID=1758395 RepID=UPI001BFD8B04|nr:acylneuraminate cytidylyltransferase family protein [Polynucleobacter sp. JS-JIR-5-A7]QWE06939.1 acylneuraminate cytidylyltransferase family protein [Polynucleobacter sp. JS-JIR-5-A7]
MINDMRVLAIIPARQGSRGLPGKNIKNLCGKPMIAWTIESGLESNYVDTLIVSTDGVDIANIAKEYGAEVPFMRPSELAHDHSTTLSVIEHAINFYQARNEYFDYIVLMEPTSPLRSAGEIDLMLEKLARSDREFDAIVSLGEVSTYVSALKRVSEAGLVEQYFDDLPTASRRQDVDPAYFPYGVAYIIKTKVLLREKTFYPSRTMGHMISSLQCYEVDDFSDFLAVSGVMNYLEGNV